MSRIPEEILNHLLARCISHEEHRFWQVCLPALALQWLPHLELGFTVLTKLNHLCEAFEGSAARFWPAGPTASKAPGRYADEGLCGCGACATFLIAPGTDLSSCKNGCYG